VSEDRAAIYYDMYGFDDTTYQNILYSTTLERCI